MPRRILLLITDLQIGGTPTVVRELAIRLREPGRVEIEVACLAKWGPVADELTAAGVRVTALGASGLIDLPKALLRLVRLIRRGAFDAVFSFLIHANAVAAAASAFCPDGRFLQSIQTTQPTPRWHWRLQRLIAPLADAVVVPSPSAARAAREWAGTAAIVIPNAVDVTSFDEIYRGRRPSGETLQVGFIGRLDPVKRVPALIEAMTRLTGAQLHVFGEGPDRPRIEATIARHRLGERVTLHGSIADPRAALSRIDVLVLPSQAEGFGLVLIEAMAAGVPVVGANVPGIRDVIERGRTGLSCGDGDPISIRCAVAEARNGMTRDRLIRAARAEVERRFDWDVVLPQYRALLRVAKRVEGTTSER